MSRQRRGARAFSAGAVALAAVAGSILWAVPAEACTCGIRDIDEALTDGQAVAIVTRTDDGSNAGGDPAKLPVGTFRVLDSIGPKVPATLRGSMDTGGSCQPTVAPGALAALAFERKESGWFLGSCSEAELGKAVQRAQGDPVTATGGPAVAYAAGAYDSSRLVALNRTGATVAWDRTPGNGQLVAVCPGGDTVVAVGRTPAEDYADRVVELTVHDAATLRVLRTVPLGDTGPLYRAAMKCTDSRADRVQLVVSDYTEGDAATLLTVRGGKVDRVYLGQGSMAQAVDEGFMLLGRQSGGPATLTLVRPDGRQNTIAELPNLNYAERFAVSPNGRTAAVFGSSGDERGTVVTVDADSGKHLGMYTRKKLYASGLAWTASGELLLRESQDYRHPMPVLAFDRTLTEQGTWPSVAGPWAGFFTTVGDAVVVYGYGSRPTATPRKGEPVVAESLRLAAAEHLIAVDGAEFGGDAEPSDASSDEVTVADEPSGHTGLLTALGGGAAVAGVAAATFVGRRNRA